MEFSLKIIDWLNAFFFSFVVYKSGFLIVDWPQATTCTHYVTYENYYSLLTLCLMEGVRRGGKEKKK
jgi:hypothetical protein